jgi:3-hydroxyisobutyrate dehydrogenase-like beta-hydroxyacid dehydrogenase
VTTIGFVGLGAMGARIAGRLLEGNHLCGTNRTPGKAAALIGQGMHWCSTPREVAENATVVFSMVTDDQGLQAVSQGPDGILAGLSPGTVYVDMSTVSPQASRELTEQVRARGATMLDAPVSGSVTAAAAGTLAVMVGGSQDAFDTVEPLLRRFASTVDHIGGNGQGLLLKLAINISLAAQMLAFSEGVLLAERAGIDPALAAGVMTRSAIGSPMLQARAPLMLDLPDEAWFDVTLMHKDIRLALRTGHELGVRLPSATTADAALTDAEQHGYAHRDIAALFQVLAVSAAPPRSSQDRAASTPTAPAADHESTS